MVQTNTRDRLTAGVGVAVLHGLLGYALISGLTVSMPDAVSETINRFDLAPPPPPPPPEKIEPRRVRSKKPEGAAAPPNLRSQPTEIVAPPPVILIIPPPVVAALEPGTGSDASMGAAEVPGPGTGSGGQGNGRGSGGEGDGSGNGNGGTPPRLLRGRLKDSDYPRAAGEAGVGGTVSVRYLIAITGRVTQCTVTRSSGNAELDETTCRLIKERFRYKPSLAEDGRPVPSIIVENHSWEIQPDPDPEAPR